MLWFFFHCGARKSRDGDDVNRSREEMWKSTLCPMQNICRNITDLRFCIAGNISSLYISDTFKSSLFM